MKTLLCALVLATIGAVAAEANSVTIALDQPDQTGMPGDILQFFGTITNTSANTLFLAGDDPNLSGLSLAFLDLFVSNVPEFLAPSGQTGDSSGDINLFDVAVTDPLLDAPGMYLGLYTLIGGSNIGDRNTLGMAGFTVTTATPEPSAVYLLLVALSAVSIRMIRDARKRASARVM